MNDLSWLTARPIAHRGYHDLNRACWENTLTAFGRAVEAGYAVECDVRLSSDGVPVVFHDDELGRLAGEEAYSWQRSAAEFGALRIGGTKDFAPTLGNLLDLVRGRVPLVIELKGCPGHDESLVERVCSTLRAYDGAAALMSFDHWLIRQLPRHAGTIPYGLTACGTAEHELEAHFAMLAHGLSFVSYAVSDLANPFVRVARENLAMPIITWTVRDRAGVEATRVHADQMTFEGFQP